MKAKSIKGNSPEEIETGLMNALSDGFTPTLGIIFLSIKQDRDAIVDILDKHGIDIFGATSAGEFIDGEVGEESTAVMLMEMDRKHFKIFIEDTGTRATREVAKGIGEAGLKTFLKPAYIVCGSGVSADGEMIIRGIEDAAGTEVTIFGGMAGDDFTMTGTYVFSNGRSSDNGIVAIIIDEDKYSLHGLATCGWQPVGTVKTITKSEGCWVYSIDNEPALDMIVKYMGISSINREKRTDIILNIGSNFPMQMENKNGSLVMRTAMLGNWNDHSFMCAGNVPEGSTVRFTIPPDFEVIESVISACTEIKETKFPEADAMILFSCKARHIALGPLVGKEIQGLKDVWDAPMVGYFAYGEFGRAPKSRQEFHNITCCWVALKEK
jgi:hypothetical protein